MHKMKKSLHVKTLANTSTLRKRLRSLTRLQVYLSVYKDFGEGQCLVVIEGKYRIRLLQQVIKKSYSMRTCATSKPGAYNREVLCVHVLFVLYLRIFQTVVNSQAVIRWSELSAQLSSTEP